MQAWRTYYQYHSEYVSAEGKLKDAEKQEEKHKQSAAKKLERLIEKVNGVFIFEFLTDLLPVPQFSFLRKEVRWKSVTKKKLTSNGH